MGKLAADAFVHLHLHSEYSLLDGAVRIRDIPRLAKEAGHTAAALTDHGNMFGAVAFYKACLAEGIRPIIGCEVYVAPRSRYLKTREGKEPPYYHLVLLCENEEGYRNLCQMVSRSYTEGFYVRPRVDMELLETYHGGLICLSACRAGYIPSCLERDDTDGARRYAQKLSEVFGPEHFYLELQDHGIDAEQKINRGLKALAAETGLPLVATNDVHYPYRRDASVQEILLCIQTNRVITDGRPFGFETDEFFYKSTEEMEALFADVPEALVNTAKIAARCSFDFTFGHLELPVYRTPDGSDPKDYLARLAYEGFEARQADGTLAFSDAHPREEYLERIQYELDVVCRMGYAEYYLIVWDFIHYAKSEGIPVGPGRGSGCGSLVAFLIGITGVDSIRYQLMFERFLNPERVSMPDFDIDFCDRRRGEVIDYVRRRYGEDHVAQIATFGTLAARAAVRDVGRALGLPYGEVDRAARLIPQELGMTLDRALELPDFRELYDSDRDMRRLIDTARALEGMPRHMSTHAAGVVITERPVSCYVPLADSGGVAVTQFDMETIADLGLLKIDFLGLRYLTIIDDTVRQIREREPSFSVETIPQDDPETYRMIAQGKTVGLFQLESGGMRSMLSELQPDNLEMIVAAISLYRPGPMDSIPRFVQNHLHPETITYRIPALADILDLTCGCIVYQEQVMQICRRVAGYSYARADLVRRAMAKKKTDVMEREREIFLHGQTDADGTVLVPGAERNGIAPADAEALFDEMASFAKYAFNKSHATAYAFTSYRTAYLKCHYPGEYFSALLSSVGGNMGKTAAYAAEAAHCHIPLLAPDINESAADFHVAEHDGKRCIRFGFLSVKNVGVHFVDEILAERREGLFADFEDFVFRMSARECSKRQVEALIYAGAFDALPQNRAQLLHCCEDIVGRAADRARTMLTGQLDLFSAVTEQEEAPVHRLSYPYPALAELPMREKLRQEREATGQYFSGHLLDDCKTHLSLLHPSGIAEILGAFASADPEAGGRAAETGGFQNGQQVCIAGLVTRTNVKTTKKGDAMAFVTLEDRYAAMELILFPRVFSLYGQYLAPDTAVYVTGTLSVREEEDPKLLAETVGALLSESQIASMTDAERAALLPAQRDSSQKDGQKPSSVQVSVQREQASAPSRESRPAQNRPASGRKPKIVSATPLPPSPRVLYLRVPDTAEDSRYLHARNLAELFAGAIPVIFYSEATREYQKQAEVHTALNPYILYQYESLLGAENVIVR